MAMNQKPTPEEVIERLRGIRSEIEDEIKEMTFEQRRDLRNKTKTSREIIVASISAVGMSDKVANALGRSAEDVQELISMERRWGAVEADLRALLNGVSSANLFRRYQLTLIATQAASIAAQLIRDPENEVLVSIVETIKHQRKLERRKRRAETAETEQEQES